MKKQIITLASIILMFGSMALVLTPPVRSTSPTCGPLKVDPPSTIVGAPNKVFNVSVTISSVLDLYGYEFRLNFNKTLINATKLFEGPFLKTAGPTQVFQQKINDTAGFVWMAETLQGSIPGAIGSGVLAKIQFKTLLSTANRTEVLTTNGLFNCSLGLYDTILIDSSITVITPSSIANGTYQYMPILGDINGDGIVNITDVGLMVQAWGAIPGNSNWNELCDLNNDGVINVQDAGLLARNWLKQG
jgi:hypothetical protein